MKKGGKKEIRKQRGNKYGGKSKHYEKRTRKDNTQDNNITNKDKEGQKGTNRT